MVDNMRGEVSNLREEMMGGLNDEMAKMRE